MMQRLGLGILLVLGLAWCAAASDSLSVYVQTEAGFVQVALGDFPLVEGTVAYEGPAAADGQANWKDTHTYKGVSVADVLGAVSGLASYDTIGVVAVDGWYKVLPANSIASAPQCPDRSSSLRKRVCLREDGTGHAPRRATRWVRGVWRSCGRMPRLSCGRE